MKKCRNCQAPLSKVGKVKLNFRPALVGGNPFGCLTWPGSYQFIILCFGFAFTLLLASSHIYLAFYGVFCPSLCIALILVSIEHPLFKCRSCKQLYAGVRLAKYSNDDTTYL
jgi:hypothetical protein